jgi:hypothetical protein
MPLRPRRLRNLVERIVRYVEDRTEDFDDYILCEGRGVIRGMLLSSMGFMINELYLNKDFNLKEFLEKAVLAIEVIKNA